MNPLLASGMNCRELDVGVKSNLSLHLRLLQRLPRHFRLLVWLSPKTTRPPVPLGIAGAPEAIDSQSEFVQFRCQMSHHVATCIYLELIGFIRVILLKRLEAVSFWPVVSILFGGLVVVGLRSSEDSPGWELRAELTGHLPVNNVRLLRIFL
jgi:hypothetical protein